MSTRSTLEPGQPDTGSSPLANPAAPRARRQTHASLAAQGEPKVWLTGAAVSAALLMIGGLLSLVIVQGLHTFWPRPLIQIATLDDEVYLGEVSREEDFQPTDDALDELEEATARQARARLARSGGDSRRRLLRVGNFDISGEHFHWLEDYLVAREEQPAWALTIERTSWGRFHGLPKALEVSQGPDQQRPEEIWRAFQQYHSQVRARWREARHLEKYEIGALNRTVEEGRLATRSAELRFGAGSSEHKHAQDELHRLQAESDKQYERLRRQIEKIDRDNDKYVLVMTTCDGQEARLKLAEIVRAYPANQLTWFGKLGVYLDRWWEFLSQDPREANSEGGVFPAIFGTVVMTLLMSLLVVPVGVLAALYMREYARPGFVLSAVRVAINNLAGVPSIVFGVFGLGFFCYIVGAQWIDPVFFEASLPNPTFGTGGLMWASLTLALLTLPVVIVATEEALGAVPRSMREGSFACGASTWQTIRRIVLPRAMPGIMTGMILAVSRGAGEVAPLMLVGAAKLAPDLPIDSAFPYLHAQRGFMHLGFHIFDLGFHSQNAEAARPMVYTTTLLLIAIIACLNIAAVWIRGSLRRRYRTSQF